MGGTVVVLTAVVLGQMQRSAAAATDTATPTPPFCPHQPVLQWYDASKGHPALTPPRHLHVRMAAAAAAHANITRPIPPAPASAASAAASAAPAPDDPLIITTAPHRSSLQVWEAQTVHDAIGSKRRRTEAAVLLNEVSR